jgi:hypothetical protein
VLRVKDELNIEPYMPSQQADGKIMLKAADAVCHGPHIRYEQGHGRDNIGFWFDAQAWVEWKFRVTQPGKFAVAAEIAAPQSASIRVRVGDSQLQAALPATGDFGKFVSVKLGTIEIPEAGKTALAVKAVAEGWHPINLKSIVLQPAE